MDLHKLISNEMGGKVYKTPIEGWIATREKINEIDSIVMELEGQQDILYNNIHAGHTGEALDSSINDIYQSANKLAKKAIGLGATCRKAVVSNITLMMEDEK